MARFVLVASADRWSCPLERAIGRPCPGCGLSRSTAAALRGDVFQPEPIAAGAILLASLPDNSIGGDRPAGIVVHNTEEKPARFRLKVSCEDTAAPAQISLSIDDGRASSSHQLTCGKVQSLDLGRLQGGEARLYIVQQEGASVPETDSEPDRGIHVHSVLRVVKSERDEQKGRPRP